MNEESIKEYWGELKGKKFGFQFHRVTREVFQYNFETQSWFPIGEIAYNGPLEEDIKEILS